MKLRSTAGLAGLVLATALAAPAAAAPVTVDLRIEGPTRTLFEGPVTTDVRPFQFTGDPVSHQCDGTPGAPQAAPTRGAALMATGLTLEGTWYAGLGPSFSRIDGESVAFAGSSWLIEYKNNAASLLGSCADSIQNGDQVLYAYGPENGPRLALSGPGRARPGEAMTVRVTDQHGNGYGGADVLGATTQSDGIATLSFTTRGVHDLKARHEGSAVRSNRLRVCVTDGADGACGTVQPAEPDTTAPKASILGIRDGRRFSRRRAPRELRGAVSADPSGLWVVKIRLTRRHRGTCWYFSGSKEQFLKRTCGKQYAFKVGEAAQWSYLLPGRLPRGRYVLDTYAIDRAFNRGEESRVRFTVR
jgi:hypothetical protein